MLSGPAPLLPKSSRTDSRRFDESARNSDFAKNGKPRLNNAPAKAKDVEFQFLTVGLCRLQNIVLFLVDPRV